MSGPEIRGTHPARVRDCAALNRQRVSRPRWGRAHGCGVMKIGHRGFVAAGDAIKRTEAAARCWQGHEATLPPRATPRPAVGSARASSWRRGRRRIASRVQGEAIVGWVDFWGLTCVVWPQKSGHPSRKSPWVRRPELALALPTGGRLPRHVLRRSAQTTSQALLQDLAKNPRSTSPISCMRYGFLSTRFTPAASARVSKPAPP